MEGLKTQFNNNNNKNRIKIGKVLEEENSDRKEDWRLKKKTIVNEMMKDSMGMNDERIEKK